MRRFVSRFSLLARFSALSLLVMILFGAVLAAFLQDRIEDRAIANAKQQAGTIVQTAVRSNIAPGDWAGVMSEARLDDLDDALEVKDLEALDVERVKLFNDAHTLIYSGDRSQLGNPGNPDSLERVFRGEVVSSLEHGTTDTGKGHRTVEVYLPVRDDFGAVEGAAEIYFDYTASAVATARDVRSLYLAVVIGVALLWLVLFRIVARASRDLRRQRDEMRYQARHDDLTELANRAALQERGAAALADDPDRVHGLLLIDLDHFKEVNDTLGHDRGDLLLREIGHRLLPIAGPEDVLTRLGGDEFALLVIGDDKACLLARADSVRAALADPVDLGTISVRVDGTVGIALCPQHGDSVDTLLKHADVAMYRAKAASERVNVYDPDEDPHSEERLVLASELAEAIEHGDLVVHYQPIVDAAGAAVRGVEALVRWDHPTRGMLPPAAFLPLAERTGAIGPLTNFVISEAVQQAHRWEQQGLRLGVAVNLASSSASDDALPALVADTLERWPLPAGRLTLELSEDTVINDPLRVGSVLERLHGLGVRISLDDFGTGQSSLAYLRKLPLDELKIDRSFVMRLEERTDVGLVDAMIALARSFGLLTVAEGVEDESTARSLARLGCDLLQGFHYSRPLPPAELERWLAARSELPITPEQAQPHQPR